jgi:DNA-binding SARP family transcriptional activator
VVVDQDGRILCRNGAASALLESLADRSAGRTCCGLLGCQATSGCPTRLTLSGDREVAEIRRDVTTTDGPRAIWVSASLIARDPARVLLQLRCGDVCDRRRQVNPAWRSAKRLRINSFGRTTILCGESTLEGGWVDQRAGDLLRYLIIRRERPVTADEIGEALWHEPGYHVVRNVRTTVHRLRSALEPGRANHQTPAYLTTRGGSYQLNLEHVELDLDEFERGMRRGLDLADHDPAAAATLLTSALALYRDELFADAPFAPWALCERARLHDLACEGLVRLADLEQASGRTGPARSALGRLATLQPLDEGVCRELVRVDIAAGRHSDAKRRYDRLSELMYRSLGYRPGFTLADLAPVTEMKFRSEIEM